jgi:hypothetical protein
MHRSTPLRVPCGVRSSVLPAVLASATLGISGLAAADEPSGARFVGFGDDVNVGVAGPPVDVAVGDVNGDGRADLAVVADGSFGGTVTLWLGLPDGSYQPQSALVSVPGATSAVDLADVDADGVLDLVVADAGGDMVQVRWGNGAGGFLTGATLVPLGRSPIALVTGFTDGDAAADIFTLNDDGTVLVITGSFDRTLGTPAVLGVPGAPTSLAAGDLDGDGDDDLVLGVPSSQVVRLVRSVPGGLSLGPALGAAGGPVSVAAGRLIGNPALEDIVAVMADGSMRIWESIGGLTVDTPQTIALGITPGVVRIADLDNDDDGDILVTDASAAEEASRVRVFVQDPDGFAEEMRIDEPLVLMDVVFADLDGNTSMDFVGLADDGEFRLVRTRINVTDVLPPGPFELAFPPDGTTGLPRPEDLVWEGATARLRWTPAAGFTVTYRIRIADNPFMDNPVLDLDGISGSNFAVPAGTLSDAFTWYWTVEACTASGVTMAEPAVAEFTMTCREDLDGDGEIGFGDALAILNAWGQVCGG